MAKNAVYGIKSVKFADVVAGGFPTTWTGFDLKAIVRDSLTMNDSAPSDNNIEVEDMDDYYAVLRSDNGSKGFTIQTYDLSAEAYKFFLGYNTATSGGWNEETPQFELGNKAIQIITRTWGDIPSKTFEWANMKLKVTTSGTIGKGGFPNLNIECVNLAHVDNNGAEVCGARWKVTPES